MTKRMLHFGKMIMIGAIAQCMLGEFALASASSIHPPSPARIDSAKPVKALPNQKRSRFNRLDFSDLGRPRKRRGGGSRGSCLVANKPPLIALVPNIGAGLTVTESPTFWFYVPYTLTSDYSVEFVLKDNQDNTVYKNKFSGKGTSEGIVNLRLPSTISLEAGKDYDWYFLIYCDAQNQDKFVYVNGSVRRVEHPDLKRQLTSTSDQDRIAWYKAEGIWYEALTVMAERVSVSPQDDKIRQDWTDLLQSVGLEEVASEPFVSCCVPGK
ncbi:MAG: DUF928 domain-containing protein [Scytonema sp. RU_4_4]|nr:DUF928 domain-containing protein [Scytonema sp. RU_4_4]NJR76161.1 DUF928 domain-containing protein [Scytonema sp. CRU_2_7]